MISSSMTGLELCILALLGMGAATRARLPGGREWLLDAPLVAIAALLSEDTSIRFYGFYEYAPGWHGFVDRTPLFIPVIWVFVVLSARDVARLLTPGREGAVLAGSYLLIWYDASLIEPICTHVGLWRWTVPGPFQVPLVGILGWAHFGVSVLFCLAVLPQRLRILTLLLAPLLTHLLVLASWWGLYRWVQPLLNGGGTDVPATLVAGLVSLALGVWLVRSRRLSSGPLRLLLPRIPPVVFFFGLLALQGAPLLLWGYALTFALPWLLFTAWRSPSVEVVASV